MGIHEFGKRTASGRSVIARAVPAIVTEAVWGKAQVNLKAHRIMRKPNTHNRFLLRGLIRCGVCGLTYIGTTASYPNAKPKFYYRCNGTNSAGLPRCTSKSVRGDELEQQVWSDVQAFLRNPKPVLEQLHARLESDAKGSEGTGKQIKRLEGLLEQKATERSRVVGLFRRGRLNEKALDEQMDEIGKEETALEAQLADLRGKVTRADSIGGTLKSAETLLAKLRKRLDEPVSWELKRHLIEVLVAGIRVETVESYGVKQARVIVSYRFSQPDQLMPVVLPQSFNPVGIRIPTQPKTIGDHIRRRRLALKLLQKQVAERVGVDKASVHNWEGNLANPKVHYMPAIIEFLGYNPLPEAKNLAERLVRHRTSLGLTQRETAARIGVDQGTLARCERGERAGGEVAAKVIALMGAPPMLALRDAG
jgi:transcriptional regulator with XRE-family HTH domain